MRFCRSSDFVILIVVSLLFTSGFAIYAVNRPVSPSFYIDNVSFKLSEVGDYIGFRVRAQRGSIEIKQLFVNNNTAYNWTADKRMVREGEEARCVVEYRWMTGEYYVLKLVTTDDRSAELQARAPQIAPSLSVEVKDMNVTLSSGFLKVKAAYRANGNVTDTLHMLLFTYLSFERSNRTVYIFYEPRYMTDESVKRADAIIKYFGKYNVTVNKVGYSGLQELSRRLPRIVLILVDPLKDGHGRRLENAAPAPLIDPNLDGYIKDDSRYGRSFLYDWMSDKGLILVTVGSLQPYKRTLYEDGGYAYAKDSLEPFDAHLFLTAASGKESIINGSFMLGNYTPVRISGALGLSYREASFGFDKDALERYGLEYYAYGDYKLPYGQGSRNLTLPIFIRVGVGGWLAMGDEEFWLSDEQLAHDLFLIYVQAVWDSKWIPYGWYWDSGSVFHANPYGVIRTEGRLETDLIPARLIGGKVVVRVVGVAYSSDLDGGFLIEHVEERSLP
jgi:hypothetical protein